MINEYPDEKKDLSLSITMTNLGANVSAREGSHLQASSQAVNVEEGGVVNIREQSIHIHPSILAASPIPTSPQMTTMIRTAETFGTDSFAINAAEQRTDAESYLNAITSGQHTVDSAITHEHRSVALVAQGNLDLTPVMAIKNTWSSHTHETSEGDNRFSTEGTPRYEAQSRPSPSATASHHNRQSSQAFGSHSQAITNITNNYHNASSHNPQAITGWGQLPLGNTHYQAREITLLGKSLDMMEAVSQSFSIHSRIVLTGVGGNGKSSLALQWANLHKADYDEVHFMVMDKTQHRLSLENLANACGLFDTQDQTEADLLRHISTRIANQRWLLIWDNVDKEADIHALLGQLRSDKPSQHLLITTRDASGFRGLKTLPIDSFTLSEAKAYVVHQMGLSNIAYDDKDIHALSRSLSLSSLSPRTCCGTNPFKTPV